MNILVTGAWQQALQYKETLESMGHTIIFMQWEKDDLPCDPAWVEGIIGNGIFLHHSIDQFVNLQYIQLTSVGFDRVPMDYVEAHHIKIFNARGVYSIPMAEYAITGVLYLYKQMDFFHENQKKHLWKKSRSLMELTDKKVLIVGCGSVGTECAKRFSVFGCRIIGINRHVSTELPYDRIVSLDQLDTELPKADIVILCLPLTEETRHIMGANQFYAMKDSAILVNLARGAIIDESVMEHVLVEKKILGAVLDVFTEEPLIDNSKLWDLENVIVTPHNSFVGELNHKRMAKLILNNIRGRNDEF